MYGEMDRAKDLAGERKDMLWSMEKRNATLIDALESCHGLGLIVKKMSTKMQMELLTV